VLGSIPLLFFLILEVARVNRIHDVVGNL
jgi:hypothetical protein